MKPLSLREKSLLVLLLAFAVIAGLFIFSQYQAEKKEAEAKAAEAKRIEETFYSLSGEAKAFSIYDKTDMKMLYERNGTMPLPLASITKVMTTVVALPVLGLENNIVIPKAAVLPEGDILPLTPLDSWNVTKLAEAMLLASSNDAALAFAIDAGKEMQAEKALSGDPLQIFLDAMNDKAKRLGLTSMHFESPNGLDINNTVPTVVGSSDDVDLLFSFALDLYPDIFGSTRQESGTFVSQTGKSYALKSTNTAAGDIPELIASKTGYTDTAGGNLVIAYAAPNGHVIILSVLGSSKEGRFTDIESLVSATNSYFSLK